MKERILIAGPCATESREQLHTTARQLHEIAENYGITINYFRAGAWKMRSAPNSFCGAGESSLPWLKEIQDEYAMPVCVEVMNAKQVELCAKYDIKTVWIGARTSVNPADVQSIADAVAHSDFSVLVKNPIIPDLKLWVGNIERFRKAEIKNVMAIHRGFTDAHENIFRNAPEWHIPIDLKILMPDLQILCDPSHLCGNRNWIPQVAQIALNYGFNGLMIECHHDPDSALSDSAQQLTPKACIKMINSLDLRSNTGNLELVKYRSLMENIDNQLVELLYQRMSIVDDIARIKRENHIAVVQPQQWQQVLKRYQKHLDDADFQNFLADFLNLLHQASIKRQQ